MKQNICIIGLAKEYVKNISKKVSDKFDMFYADVDELVQFDLIDVKRASDICGEDYIKKIEYNKASMLATFENTLFTMQYNLLNNSKIRDVVQENAVIIYLYLDKESIINKLKRAKTTSADAMIQTEMFEDRDMLCSKYSEIKINCCGKTVLQTIRAIKEALLSL